MNESVEYGKPQVKEANEQRQSNGTVTDRSLESNKFGDVCDPNLENWILVVRGSDDRFLCSTLRRSSLPLSRNLRELLDKFHCPHGQLMTNRQ